MNFISENISKEERLTWPKDVIVNNEQPFIDNRGQI